MPSVGIEELRRELREKFPGAHARTRPETASGEGDDAARRSLEADSFSAGMISEVVPAGPAAGLSLLIAHLTGDPETPSPRPEFILIDGSDAFDPASFTGAACSRLLWVRCASATEMLRAADLLARDGNVPFLLLDASGLSRAQLADIPASAWWRLKGVAGQTGGRLVVMAPRPVVPCAGARFTLAADLSLRDFDRPRAELTQRLNATPRRLRRAT